MGRQSSMLMKVCLSLKFWFYGLGEAPQSRCYFPTNFGYTLTDLVDTVTGLTGVLLRWRLLFYELNQIDATFLSLSTPTQTSQMIYRKQQTKNIYLRRGRQLFQFFFFAGLLIEGKLSNVLLRY